MKKRIITLISAAAISAAAVPTIASADYGWIYNDRLADFTEGCTEVNDRGCFRNYAYNDDYSTLYDEENGHFMILTPVNDLFFADFRDEASGKKAVERISEFAPDWDIKGEGSRHIAVYTNSFDSAENFAAFSALAREFKEYGSLTSFESEIGHIGLEEFDLDMKAMKYYFYKEMPWDDIQGMYEDMLRYIEENELPCEIVLAPHNDFVGSDSAECIVLSPIGEPSFDEQLDVYISIAEGLNLTPGSCYRLFDASDFIGQTVNMAGNTDGDANCDNELSIADATAIMQAIGNPDEYALSAQGIFNADIYGTGDGITGMDALEVMKGCLIKN